MTEAQKLAIIRGAKVKLEAIAEDFNIGVGNANLHEWAIKQELTSVRDQLTYLIGEL